MACRVYTNIIWANKGSQKAKLIKKQQAKQNKDLEHEKGRIFAKIKSGRSYKQLHNLVEIHGAHLQIAHIEQLFNKVTGIYNANRLKLPQAQQILSDAVQGQYKEDNIDFFSALIEYLNNLVSHNKIASAVDFLWSITQLDLLQDLPVAEAKLISEFLNQTSFREKLSQQQKCKLFHSYLWWKFGGETVKQEDADNVGYFLNGLIFEECQIEWKQSVQQTRIISNLQQEVYEVCKKVIKADVEQEKISDEGYWSIDIAVNCNGTRVAIEVEGRNHLSSENLLKRRNFLRYQALQSQGWQVLVVPFVSWNRCISEAQKIEYIQQGLSEVGVGEEFMTLPRKVEEEIKV
eukprot:TRINITY_DN23355_c0_g1_i5.p1 TRINITY_DN23355_c0_g1~~TRINITY_DN23355_c0_g1_i5.p1  ORF type:complete len:395 (-),score=49.91 TRINITY_DN23355_c0_g1_i5:197-1237(-)